VSGFAALVRAEGAFPEERLVRQMANRLAFRGPDETHVWTQPGAAFCFTLLRTGPAPQSKTQPCSLDGRVWLLGDVRLDGRNDLRRKLQQSGATIPTSATDEQLILHSWQLWGEDGLSNLLGDFSFALWHPETRRLLCVRDLLGLRPFFYALDGGWLYFSNTLHVLRLVPTLSSALDPEFIGDFLLQGSCSDPTRTAFSNISRLPGGHFLRYSSDGVEVRRYKSLPIEEPLWLKRPEEYVERFRTLLGGAVGDRLPRGPTAILMSGGLDSTSVAAMANNLAQELGTSGSVRAYTVDYTPLFEDQEGYYASLAAKHLGIAIEPFSGAGCLPYEGWDDLMPLMAEPSNEPFLLLNQQQYHRVQTHTRVALSGLGGDDLLTGQAWPYLIYLLRHSRFGTIGKSFGAYLLKHRRIPPLLGGFHTRFRQWMSRPDPMEEYPRWLESDFEKRLCLREKWLELQRPRKSAHPLYPLGYAGLTSHYWSGVFEGEDSASTGIPVELRAPLLDERVLRYLLRVPPVPWCAHKDLLRKTMRGLLPEKIRLRPKTPLLGDPLALHAERGDWSPEPLQEPARELREFVNWEQLRATLASAAVSTLWTHLCGLSLDYWFKGIENERWIR
jgi:asparagine synthase (glutamine-hydrolysing)